ncbi:hypothetical protein N7456_000694 [Penicillium angulare]|uniref:Uncharacterized protein n=1 Tax=Penicillium angulare TaxID=116970 RepID=A0A9W9GCZ5_9EURO|nr:hypothetical protein N7456_000694 [Penicillium angulare]
MDMYTANFMQKGCSLCSAVRISSWLRGQKLDSAKNDRDAFIHSLKIVMLPTLLQQVCTPFEASPPTGWFLKIIWRRNTIPVQMK